MPDNSQDVEAMENLKINDQCRNTTENKGLNSSRPAEGGNVLENKDSYA
jgi:hypothetical protein